MNLQQSQQPDLLTAGAAIFCNAFDDGLRPDEPLTVSQWADKFRRLSQRSSAEPGQWRTDRTPYLREIMDCLSTDSQVEHVVLMGGAQLGKTEAGNNWIGYIIHKALGPTMAVLPTVDTAKRSSRQRIQPLIDETPALRALVKEAKARDSGNTMLLKEFPGGLLIMTGANSAAGLRSMPARNLFLDEVDAYPANVDEEGDPVNLAVARTRTFPRRKIFMTSTPTVAGQSRIETAFEASDRRRFWIPCPRCGVYQYLKFANVAWPKGEPEKAVYVCEECEQPIENHEKTWMLERGEWRADAPFDGKVAGFHLNSLYSPVGWFSWADAAKAFAAAQSDPDKLRVFVNTNLAETWKERGETVDWRRLYDRAEDYKLGTCPPGVCVLFAGADVQKNRIEVYVYGYGENLEQWLVDQIVLDGSVYDTESPRSPWLALNDVMEHRYSSSAGAMLPIQKLAIDSGFEAPVVYAWAAAYSVGHVLVCKGRRDGNVLARPTDNIEYADKRRGNIRLGHQLWIVSTTLAKDQVFGWLSKEAPTREAIEHGAKHPQGFLHTPKVDENYFQQLTAESKIKGVYQKVNFERNEALDTKVLADVAAFAFGVHRYSARQWQYIRDRYQPAESDPTQPGIPQPAAGAARRKGGSWQTVGRW